MNNLIIEWSRDESTQEPLFNVLQWNDDIISLLKKFNVNTTPTRFNEIKVENDSLYYFFSIFFSIRRKISMSQYEQIPNGSQIYSIISDPCFPPFIRDLKKTHRYHFEIKKEYFIRKLFDKHLQNTQLKVNSYN